MRVHYSDIEAAATRLAAVIDNTPLDRSQTYSLLSHNKIYLKLENMQRTGSFKIRGAYNKLALLSEQERSRGVIAASAGNHAQGVAYAARELGIPCTIVMPKTASLSKVEATRRYGAAIVLHGQNYDDAYAKAKQLQEATGLTFVHAFDDPDVIAGQGTIGLELLRQNPNLDAIVVPVGGGGLISGIAIAAKTIKPQIKIYGVEASGAACFRRSLDTGDITTLEAVSTIADGIAVKRPGNLTWDAVKNLVDDVFVVDDEGIARTMVMLMERSKVVSEGASASALAAVLTGHLPFTEKEVAVVISGGNVDMMLLSRIIEHGLVAAGRHARFVTTLPDRPGSLANLVAAVADVGANIVSIEHHRLSQSLVLGQVEVDLAVETRNEEHIEELRQRFLSLGYSFQMK
ncbi:threonine ammonia-lyase [Sulfoacidibacillus thermotolerans]|uniref:L-threonine dehydratase catabolic TdcB n=1 Tax=Sulfoacidibacillus thermotolerans TaxID=1765684 RepID=A0A2U3DCC5_SULT2|nr:threonine ammonia-lyase [Sulfoacidibacillus thermotolerans]PWI58895.1 threonine ammonia-lyase [Sulfoacidibacillus thermotolerans]